MLLLFQSDGGQQGQHDLTAVGVTIGAPTLVAPSLAQIHALVAAALTAGVVTLGAPAITQAHALTAAGTATGAPTLAAPTLGQVHALTAAGLSSGAPTLEAPALGGDAPPDALTPANLTAGVPSLAAPGIGQWHVLAAALCDCQSPTLETPALKIVGVLPDSPRHRPIVAPGLETAEDLAVEALARVQDIAAEIVEIERFVEEVEAAGEEFVDVLDHDPLEDTELTGRLRRGRR